MKGQSQLFLKRLTQKKSELCPAPLNKDFHKQTIEIKNLSAMDTIVCYALDKLAWRDVRINTIKDWYEGYPKEI